MGQRVAIKRVRGDTTPVRYRVIDDAGDPVDIASHSAVMTVGTSPNPTDTASRVFEVAGVRENPTSAGIFSFRPSEAQMDLNVDVRHYYDVQITDDGGFIDTPRYGRFKVRQDQSK